MHFVRQTQTTTTVTSTSTITSSRVIAGHSVYILYTVTVSFGKHILESISYSNSQPKQTKNMFAIKTSTFLSTIAVVVMMTIHMMIVIDAFPVTRTQSLTSSSSSSVLRMVPKFVGNKWVPQSPEEGPEAGYDIVGTLLRQGPEPALTRIFSPDDYEQAVLKFMASEKCDRDTAQGNMDAYLRNPPDWTYVRMEDQKRGFVRDYVTLKPLEVGKVLVWSTIVFALVGRAIYALTTGNRFNL